MKLAFERARTLWSRVFMAFAAGLERTGRGADGGGGADGAGD
jgi:hypothetical protein